MLSLSTLFSDVAQLVRASDSYPEGRQFDSARRYHEVEYLPFIKTSKIQIVTY